MLHRLLAVHDDVGWISTFNETFPTQTWLSIFSGLYRSPLPLRLKHMQGFPKPFEAYRFWDRYLPGFSRRDHPPTAEDVPAAGIDPIRVATTRILKFQRKARLLIKVTGWARIAYFDRIYPDAVFISLRREPRSVISSWVKAGWLDVTSAPGSEDWQWGDVPPAYYEVWRELGGDPVLTAALKMRLDLDDIARNMALFPDRCHELWYEDLITSPETTLRAICQFADLEWTPRFERVVGAMSFYDSTNTWRQLLSEEQGDLVLEFLRRTDAIAGSRGTAASAATR
jgi:Sulfotransferase family